LTISLVAHGFERLADRKPDVLYHYTTRDGFLGLIHSHKLWASSVFHMNDTAEFRYALDLAQSCDIEGGKSVSDGHFDSAYKAIIEHSRCYVVSFSEKRDDLSQWRAYSGNSGYCIGFRTDFLLNHAEVDNYFFRPCLYDRAEQVKQLQSLLVQAPSVANNSPINFIAPLVMAAVTMKHPSFKDEVEWRFATIDTTDLTSPSGLHFRSGRSFLIPYRTISFARPKHVPLLPIAEVWIGPTPFRDLALSTTRQLLESHGLKGVDIQLTSTPYRSD
jgi:Protein of unknown function (DUF2971)